MSINELKDKWEALPGKKKGQYVLFGSIAVILLASYLFTGEEKKRPTIAEQRANEKGYDVEIFGDDRGLADLEELNSKVDSLSRLVSEQVKGYEETSKQLRETNLAISEYKQMFDDPEKMTSLETRLKRLNDKIEQVNQFTNEKLAEMKNGQNVRSDGTKQSKAVDQEPKDSSIKADSSNSKQSEVVQDDPFASSSDPFESFSRPVVEQTAEQQLSGKLSDESEVKSSMSTDETGGPQTIRTVGVVAGDLNGSSRESMSQDGRNKVSGNTNEFNTRRDLIANQEKEEKEIYIPAASILQGVLLNGVDAPTEGPNPHPVVIRINSEGLLPNGHKFPFQDCRVLAEIRGEINSERGLGRTVTLSCIWNNGEVVDMDISGYLVGADGSAGIRGKLVTKEGQIIKKSIIAGTLGGIGQAATPQTRNSVQTGENAGGIDFVAPPLSQIAKTGVYQGASNAADRVAQYYIDQLDQIFPFVEIPALREADIVLTKGIKLPTQPR